MTSHAPRLNRRVFTVFVLVGIPLLVAGMVAVLAAGRARLADDYGRHLSQVARQTAAAVDSHLYRVFSDVVELGRTPTLRDAVTAANRRAFDAAEVARLDDTWVNGVTLSSTAAAVLDNPAAGFLLDIAQYDQTYVELLLTDRHGRLVAASQRVDDYDQSDEDWWKLAIGDGSAGQAMVSGVRWDDGVRRNAIEITVLVPETGSDRLGGVLKVTADAREMLALVGGLRLGATGHAMLLLEDGTVVFGSDIVAPGTEFFAARAFRDQVDSLRGGDPQQTSHFEADASGGEPFLVGLAPSQLAATFPHLAWFVAVMQAESELLAPVQGLGWYLLAAFALSALAVTFLAFWLSMSIARPPVDTDLHLVRHPPVTHVGTTDEPILAEEDTA